MSRFEKRTAGKGVLRVPETPSMGRLYRLYGEPPWTMEVPYPDILPKEALGNIGTVIIEGAVFRRERGFREQMRELRESGMSRREAFDEMGIDEDG